MDPPAGFRHEGGVQYGTQSISVQLHWERKGWKFTSMNWAFNENQRISKEHKPSRLCDKYHPLHPLKDLYCDWFQTLRLAPLDPGADKRGEQAGQVEVSSAVAVARFTGTALPSWNHWGEHLSANGVANSIFPGPSCQSAYDVAILHCCGSSHRFRDLAGSSCRSCMKMFLKIWRHLQSTMKSTRCQMTKHYLHLPCLTGFFVGMSRRRPKRFKTNGSCWFFNLHPCIFLNKRAPQEHMQETFSSSHWSHWWRAALKATR